MAKKKHHKKHQFKQRTAAASQPVVQPNPDMPRQSTSANVDTVTTIEHGHLGFVRRDVRKVITLALIFIVFQLGLAFLFHATSLGNAVYGLVKL